jgi:hypothetical protein
MSVKNYRLKWSIDPEKSRDAPSDYSERHVLVQVNASWTLDRGSEMWRWW